MKQKLLAQALEEYKKNFKSDNSKFKDLIPEFTDNMADKYFADTKEAKYADEEEIVTFLEAFIYLFKPQSLYNINIDDIKATESPDFLVNMHNKKYAFEVTTVGNGTIEHMVSKIYRNFRNFVKKYPIEFNCRRPIYSNEKCGTDKPKIILAYLSDMASIYKTKLTKAHREIIVQFLSENTNNTKKLEELGITPAKLKEFEESGKNIFEKYALEIGFDLDCDNTYTKNDIIEIIKKKLKTAEKYQTADRAILIVKILAKLDAIFTSHPSRQDEADEYNKKLKNEINNILQNCEYFDKILLIRDENQVKHFTKDYCE